MTEVTREARIDLLFTMSDNTSGSGPKSLPDRSRECSNLFLTNEPFKARALEARRQPPAPKLRGATVAARKPGPTNRIGGARRDRTDDLLLAKQALSQLSYGPDRKGLPSPKRQQATFAVCRRACQPKRREPRRLVGLGRFELPTSRLSSARSNQLSYKPVSEDRGRTTDDRLSIKSVVRRLSSVL